MPLGDEVSPNQSVAKNSQWLETEFDTDDTAQGSDQARHHTVFQSESFFDIPQRPLLKLNPFKATFNLVLAFGLIGALIAGYAIGLQVFDLGITSIGLYGTVLLSEYFVQVVCAVSNRFDVNRIATRLRERDRSEVSIAVVGYREDERAWRHCLRSLQMQTLAPKCIIGVVDGNDEPDLAMAEAFVNLHRDVYFDNVPHDTRSRVVKFWHYLAGKGRPGHARALSLARQAVVDQVVEWNCRWGIEKLDAVCFSQPHGHKRTAMFTAFAMSMYAVRTRDAVFTTDSDTLVQDNALDEMLALLRSAPDIGGVTADVKIWNRAEGLLTRLCAARYWFAFNIERACQSTWRCVGCLSGPMSMYRTFDLETILGPWNLQTFGNKRTTFGDDRHLTNQLLAHGLKTRYTHRTWCDTESPTTFVRWVAQQTRWSKSFFREAFWFPASFAYQSAWMLVEMTIQALYPFILVATAFHLIFDASDENKWRALIWLATMFGIALLKSLVALFICWDPWLLLFACYGFIYFFGLLPSKLWALLTMNKTGWGTSARSSAERKRGQSFLQRSFHVGHLVVWYLAIFVGIGFFMYKILGNALFFLIGVTAVLASISLYWNPNWIATLKIIRWSRTRKVKSADVETMDERKLPEKPLPAHTSTKVSSESVDSEMTPAVSMMDSRESIEVLPRVFILP
ncbi:glycosyltransferase family 2 protein [Pseudocercospora fijiensis CIRAD86]|uniref:Glycosyltransferase family 2 protein n=1 Tax=Pseudocercospora fijiensis (strain CIRAD86) TaxID=383855 RepID=N1QC29_PSEFD|nr:glycosyltransferase family 2 protein [Pseudocercospora fijiensis CIRAD86]EME88838.1 glycosyltransferase family 2 protein [Pseudocercospora fijiensis CIRAD86]